MSTDDLRALLDSIGPEAGPDGKVDPAWEALTMGELPEDAVASLRARAATSSRDAELLDLFDPLEADYVDRLADRVVARRPGAPEPVEVASTAWTVPPSEDRAVEADAVAEASWFQQLLDLIRRPVVLTPMLLAALVLLVVAPRMSTQDLPAYEVELRSGDALERSTVAASSRHAVGSRFEVVLTPDAAVDGSVDVQAILDLGGRDIPFSVSTDVADGGRILVRGLIPELDAVGDGEVVLTILGQGSQRVVRVPVTIVQP